MKQPDIDRKNVLKHASSHMHSTLWILRVADSAVEHIFMESFAVLLRRPFARGALCKSCGGGAMEAKQWRFGIGIGIAFHSGSDASSTGTHFSGPSAQRVAHTNFCFCLCAISYGSLSSERADANMCVTSGVCNM